MRFMNHNDTERVRSVSHAMEEKRACHIQRSTTQLAEIAYHGFKNLCSCENSFDNRATQERILQTQGPECGRTSSAQCRNRTVSSNGHASLCNFSTRNRFVKSPIPKMNMKCTFARSYTAISERSKKHPNRDRFHLRVHR